MVGGLKFKVQSLKSPLERRRFCPDSPQANWKQNQRCVLSFLLGSFCVLLFSCGGDTNNTDALKNDSLNVAIKTVVGEAQIIEPVEDEEKVSLTNNGITLTEIKSDGNKDAAIELTTKQFKEGVNQLKFSVSGVAEYKVSYLANNYSLSQFSTPNFDVELLYGNNVFLAFLTGKNGVSIKTNKGSVLKNVVLGDMESLFDMNQPHLFYYLPQTNGVNPILDFYLVNTSINPNGNKVKVTINQTEFIVSKWAAYQISGLPKADNKIRIQLIDKNEKLIDGPFNDSGDRVFNLLNKTL